MRSIFEFFSSPHLYFLHSPQKLKIINYINEGKFLKFRVGLVSYRENPGTPLTKIRLCKKLWPSLSSNYRRTGSPTMWNILIFNYRPVLCSLYYRLTYPIKSMTNSLKCFLSSLIA